MNITKDTITLFNLFNEWTEKYKKSTEDEYESYYISCDVKSEDEHSFFRNLKCNYYSGYKQFDINYNLDLGNLNFELLENYILYLQKYEEIEVLSLKLSFHYFYINREMGYIVKDNKYQNQKLIEYFLEKLLRTSTSIRELYIEGIDPEYNITVEMKSWRNENLENLSIPNVAIKIDSTSFVKLVVLTCDIEDVMDISMYMGLEQLIQATLRVRTRNISNLIVKIPSSLIELFLSGPLDTQLIMNSIEFKNSLEKFRYIESENVTL